MLRNLDTSGDAFARYEACRLCPRECGINRADSNRGFCGADSTLTIARAALHFWEEPPLSGDSGSGAIFFSHCPLKCCFCQNADISERGWGKPTTVEGLAESMLMLQSQGACNINLVTATHYVPHVVAAVDSVRFSGMSLPVLYNTSGYELPETLGLLEDTVQVWLPDFKYHSSELSLGLSKASDYPHIAMEAVEWMVDHVRRHGGRHVDEQGLMKRGIIVRHLVLPGHVDDSLNVVAQLWHRFGNKIDISIMNQYTPLVSERLVASHPELLNAVSGEDYETVLDFADFLGFENIWWQQGGTVDESFIPSFDGTGVCSDLPGEKR